MWVLGIDTHVVRLCVPLGVFGRLCVFMPALAFLGGSLSYYALLERPLSVFGRLMVFLTRGPLIRTLSFGLTRSSRLAGGLCLRSLGPRRVTVGFMR